MSFHWDTAALEMPNSLARALAEPALAMISDLLIEAPLRCNVNDSLQKSNTYKKISLHRSLVALTFIPCPSTSHKGLLGEIKCGLSHRLAAQSLGHQHRNVHISSNAANNFQVRHFDWINHGIHQAFYKIRI